MNHQQGQGGKNGVSQHATCGNARGKLMHGLKNK